MPTFSVMATVTEEDDIKNPQSCQEQIQTHRLNHCRKVIFTLGLGERRKEEKGEKRSRFVEISLWISSRVIPTKYVRSHSIGSVHPRANHDLFQQFKFLKA
ncbi:hypothetical protein H5410_039033 [Solanum commersonii]|uniref:Uncharacterized protein n=1 Tax=Solanum commersonii TaxID=4109 RepID=A0A9J5YBV5_SOLCO|nr:hypothetical protein H5410_039033 [Solanum commersonii]